MLKTNAAVLLLALSTVATPDVAAQTLPPDVRFVWTREDARGLARDPSAVLADPGAVAALAAFVAPLQRSVPRAPDPELGPIDALLAGIRTR